MKQKYTLLIADMEINIITEEPQESVEYIVGVLDRKMREFLLKSKRCSKNEAALLCALDFCAEKIKIKEKSEELENELESSNTTIKVLNEKIEMLQKNAERLEKENARLEVENDKLHAVLDEERAGTGNIPVQIKAAKSSDSPKVIKNEQPVDSVIEEPVGDIFAANDEAIVISNTQSDSERDDESAQTAKKSKGRNRVGSMFDLLTFGDV